MTTQTPETVLDPQVGETIPEFVLPLTVQRMVMEAAANRDFASMHHDTRVAQDAGAPDMFVNTFFLQTLFELTLRQWTGPAGRLKRMGFQMRIFNCAGDTLHAAGKVTAVRTEGDQRIVDLDIWVDSERGRTVIGTATVALPLPTEA